MAIPFTKKNKKNVLNAIERKISFKKLTTEEWHQFVQNYNYDDGIEPFKWLIKEKICDKGTALCLYWYLQPDFYCNKENQKTDNEIFLLLKELETLYLKGFYENEQFSFNPKIEFLETVGINISGIPKEMLEKTNGISFEQLSIEHAFLRKPNEKELKILEKHMKDAVEILLLTNKGYKYENADDTVSEIVSSLKFWKKDRGLKEIKLNSLSYLWLDCIHLKHNWDWVMWDDEDKPTFGVSSKTKKTTCLADRITRVTPSLISDLYYDLEGVCVVTEIEFRKRQNYITNALCFDSEHLKYHE